jgi:hypothetical protein
MASPEVSASSPRLPASEMVRMAILIGGTAERRYDELSLP